MMNKRNYKRDIDRSKLIIIEYSDEIIILNRAAKKMNEEQRKQLLAMAKVMFKEAFI